MHACTTIIPLIIITNPHRTPLQTTLRFEQEMATRFGITAATLANNTTNNTTTTTGSSSTNSPVYPGGAVATTSYNGSNNNGNGNSNDKEERRLKSQDKLMYVPTDHRVAYCYYIIIIAFY